MIRKAFKMKLKSGYKDEYKLRHDEIWQELKKALKEAGIYDYSIYLDEETNIIFAVYRLRENHKADQLAERKIMRQWWDYMADLMEVKDDNSPVVVPLEEMFHME